MIKKYDRELSEKYENIRKQNKDILQRNRETIAKEVPEVIEIEEKIAKLCIDVSISTLKKMDNREQFLLDLREQITNLRIKKSELLVAHGYSMDYLNLPYTCEKCQDTGYVGNKKCSCYKKYLTEIYYKSSNLKDLLSQCNFATFDINLYEDKITGREPKSPRDNMETNLAVSINFVKNFYRSDENLFFYGSPGIGKTFLSCSIARALLDSGVLVLYRTCDDLIRDFKQIRFKEDQSLQELLLECDLLIIDDLGTEFNNDFTKSELFNLINKRLLTNKKMIISSNFSLEKIMEIYSDRISSRLLGNFTLCKFYGEDIRVKLNLIKNPVSLR
ncbi:DNA replication protein DnaC [Hathewaya proteolytica DSM 3090]|uniref:DNA replication protein DnaC n=1 Tax=Hathewaya proteolytica DSM 3090 TaxID=1121331 RepID=A0A1M6MQH9_9CLOT|nr:ATP-binding protein [Hathewaya proteolytica]SHJ85731.1 DNA replication protein DnaC [Hathewaya proteolytica DSM 3090]